MTADPAARLDQALAELGRTLAKRGKPTRYDARAILIALGELVLAGDTETVDRAVGRLEPLVAPEVEAWRRAVADELALAGTEHVQSVDPRWLDHPRYDFAYTVAARVDLEARLRAAERLDLAPNEDLLNRIARADALLAPYLRGRAGKESSN